MSLSDTEPDTGDAVHFLRLAGRLKSTKRTGWTRYLEIERPENLSEFYPSVKRRVRSPYDRKLFKEIIRLPKRGRQ